MIKTILVILLGLLLAANGYQTEQAGPFGLGLSLIIIGLPLLVWFIIPGGPLAFENPELGTFNISGGLRFSPEFLALTVGLALFTAAFIAEIIRGGMSVLAGTLSLIHASDQARAEIDSMRKMVDPALVEDALAYDLAPASYGNPYRALEDQDRRSLMRSGLDQLPDKLREAVRSGDVAAMAEVVVKWIGKPEFNRAILSNSSF